MTDWHSCYDARDAIASKNEFDLHPLKNLSIKLHPLFLNIDMKGFRAITNDKGECN